MSLFRAPDRIARRDRTRDVAAKLIAAAADIALIIDADGIVRDVAFGITANCADLGRSDGSAGPGSTP